MRPFTPTLAITLALIAALAGAALAHSGVKNPTVMARMMLMEQIGQATGTLGKMAKGTIPFDATQADQARAVLERTAGEIPAAFEANETDPKSESLPQIWTDWAGFTAQANAMQAAARALRTDTLDDLRAGMDAIGQSCGQCHKAYRIAK